MMRRGGEEALRGALDSLYSESGERLATYGLLLTGNRADARDLVRAGAEVALRSRRVKTTTDAEARARAQMRRMYLRAVRRGETPDAQVKSTGWEPPVVLRSASESPDDDRSPLERALAVLPARLRAATVLRSIDGWEITEIARALRTREVTAERYVAEGREALAALAGVSVDEPEWIAVEGDDD